MASYAIIKDGKVSNVVVSDSVEPLTLFFTDPILEVTDSTGAPAIGFAFDEDAGKFVPACYNAGWTFNRETWTWQSPVPYPADGKFYDWDNDSESWAEIEISTDAVRDLPEA